MMEEAIVVVSFGTSYPEAKRNSLDQIYGDVVKAFPEKKVLEAYTSSIILKKLMAEGRPVYSVKEAMDFLKKEHISKVTVLPTHMIPGIEYKKLEGVVKQYEAEFEEICLLDTVLHKQADCEKIAALVVTLLQIEKGKEYILMGHGTEDVANIRYVQMNEAFLTLGYDNVRIASVEAKPDLWDALEDIEKGPSIVLHPFMVVAGDHANNDMAGEKDSFKSILEERGFQVEVIVKGLGEYSEFRREYVAKLSLSKNGLA